MIRSMGVMAILLAAAALATGVDRAHPGEPRRAEAVAVGTLGARGGWMPGPASARSAPPVVIGSIAPDTLRPDSVMTITGSGFDPVAGRNRVVVGTRGAEVLSATVTELVVRVPEVVYLGCDTARTVPVRVQAGGGTDARDHPLRTAAWLDLQPGEVATLDRTGGADCVELAQTGGEYLVGVVNAGDTLTRDAALLGAFGARRQPTVEPVVRDTGLVPAPLPAPPSPGADPARAAVQEHIERLELQAAQAQEVTEEAQGRGRLLGTVLPRALPAVGQVDSMRILESIRTCDGWKDVEARVAYVGARVIVLEDVSAPFPRAMDAEYALLAREFETKMWDLVAETFGNPLARDGMLDGDGRIRILFTPKVREVDTTYAGFVTPCDLHPRDREHPASNVSEVLYALPLRDGMSRVEWLRRTRATVVHELKHLVAYAERISRGLRVERAWLEEATAMAAEELYSRTFSRAGRRANVKYALGLRCEFLADPANPECRDWPLSMELHFGQLYYDLATGRAQPLLKGGYGGGWALVRWAADVSPDSEEQFFSALLRNDTVSLENLADVLEQPVESLLVDWVMALALDDWPGFRPLDARYSLPGWDMRDVYGTLYRSGREDAPKLPYPVMPDSAGFGAVALARRVPHGTGQFAVVHGTQAATQLLWIAAPNRRRPADRGLYLVVARLR